MHLEHAILGFLNYRPWTGYELKRVFDVSIRHFWPADQSQIYKTLARLADQGLAEVEVVHQSGRPSRKVYQITKAGREAFREWVSSTPVPEEFRDPFLIQVFFAGLLSDDETIAMLEAKAEELRGALRHCEAEARETVSETSGASSTSARDRFFWFVTIDHGLWMIQAAIDWLEETIERIRNKDYESGETGAVLPPPRRKR